MSNHTIIKGLIISGAITVLITGVPTLHAESSNGTTVCAHRKTGAMRYLARGNCKSSTEQKLVLGAAGPSGSSGPEGPPGSIGAIGPKGDIGAKGDTGPAGPQGITGPQGRNLVVRDANNKKLGLLASIEGGNVLVHDDTGVWTIRGNKLQNVLTTFLDATCATPTALTNEDLAIWAVRSQYNLSYQLVGTWKMTGSTSPQGSRTIYSQSWTPSGPTACNAMGLITGATLYDLVPVSPLTFTAPVQITNE